jgi:hypothetical protein
MYHKVIKKKPDLTTYSVNFSLNNMWYYQYMLEGKCVVAPVHRHHIMDLYRGWASQAYAF